jgi:hypothetical protein
MGTHSVVTFYFSSSSAVLGGTSSNFLAEVFGINTPKFPWKTQFYSTFSSLLLYSPLRCCISVLQAIAQLVACLLMAQLAHISSAVEFFNHYGNNGYGGCHM